MEKFFLCRGKCGKMGIDKTIERGQNYESGRTQTEKTKGHEERHGGIAPVSGSGCTVGCGHHLWRESCPF
jgi:hypothetical protein